MAWKEVKVEEQRIQFIKEYLEGKCSKAELFRQYEISPRNGYKWINRFNSEGLDGLKDRSRAPKTQASATDPHLIEQILAVRFKYKTWGPKKVYAYLKSNFPDIEWPATTTIGNLFNKHGLTVSRKYRRRVPAQTIPLSDYPYVNDTWCTDFKGWFLTGDGRKCEPFTLTDACSRYLLRCLHLDSNNTEHVWAVLDTAFREYGLPLYLRNDNGIPFATCGVGRLSTLSVRLIKAGVIPEWIDPGKPQQNGRHERMHLTLKQEAATPPASNLELQQMNLLDFQKYYNEVRPHESLGQKPPKSIYQPSDRIWNGRLKSPEYSSEYHVRKVRGWGVISWKDQDLFIGRTLASEPVGLKENEDGSLTVYYGPIILGIIDQNNKFNKPENKGRVRKRISENM